VLLIRQGVSEMKIRDSVSKETLKQFKNMLLILLERRRTMLFPLRIGIGMKSWKRDAKHTNDQAAVFGENDNLMGTVVFWVYG